MLDYKIYYERRIQFLQLQANQLFSQINMLETEINKKKQQNLQPIQQNVDLLNEMVQRLLCMNGEIKTCQHFYAMNQPFTDMNYFNEIYTIYFNKLLQDFNKKLRLNRMQRMQLIEDIQDTQNFHENCIDELINPPVHFQIDRS